MTVHLHSPDALAQDVPYRHVAVGTGTRHVHVAGQVARTREGSPVGTGDLAAQVAHALRNTHAGLVSAGATFADVVRLTFYVTEWRPERIDAFMAGVTAVADELGIPLPLPPSSLIGVDVLFEADVLVEVEAIAIVDGGGDPPQSSSSAGSSRTDATSAMNREMPSPSTTR